MNVLTGEVKRGIERSVLCWLATQSEDGYPNVSPKEAFLHDGGDKILIANIASPESVRNIKRNPKVCLSFVDVFVQKGYKIKGQASLFEKADAGYDVRHEKLLDFIGPKYEIRSVIEVEPEQVDEIIAPSYFMFPEITEEEMIRSALKTYEVVERQEEVE